MNGTLKFGLSALAGLVTAAALTTGTLAAGTLNGAGGTAIYPVLSVWAQKYQQKTGTAVNYQAIGSGGGIAQIKAKTVDFGNSDKPLMHDELASSHLVQFPQVIITIVPVVHLPGIKSGEMVIDGPTLANIYLGKITKWNDAAIKKLNPHVPLPNMSIVVVHRSDGSGTTFNFTNYLGKVSPEWKSSVGSDTSVSWPAGIGGKGNAGVAANVAQTVGSIGYVEYAYLMENKNITYMNMINHDGKLVKPNMETFQSAAAHADFSKVQDFYLILTDQPGANSWPIVAATYMLMRNDYPAAKNRDILKFLDYGLHEGAADATKLDYVPFPETVVKQIEASWTAQLHAWP
ncbi:MAG: phosphate ABC transporter substrate-binding protein PstS [Alphaproteobacteria bacterium]|nr:phosphate ABC transporter substrate-binding protein PstS [Alphaproteobacteria bacterium]